MLAKYASDLHGLGGVSDEPLRGGGHALEGLPRGRAGLDRRGTQWQANSSSPRRPTAPALAAGSGELPRRCLRPRSARTRAPPCPMYLDKFDKYGFGFWYAARRLPPGPGDDLRPGQAGPGVRQKDGASACKCCSTPTTRTAPRAWRTSRPTAGPWTPTGWLGVPTFVQFGGGTAGGLWLANRWPEQMQQHAPGFEGDWYGNVGDRMGGPPAHIDFSSGAAEDAENAIIARMVKHYAAYPNVTGYLEPHGEMGESPVDLMLEYGPVADANYRRYLRGKYQTPQAVDRRWSGGARHGQDLGRRPPARSRPLPGLRAAGRGPARPVEAGLRRRRPRRGQGAVGQPGL